MQVAYKILPVGQSWPSSGGVVSVRGWMSLNKAGQDTDTMYAPEKAAGCQF